jgi:hypothetical protein
MNISGNRVYNRDGSLGKTKICDPTNTVQASPSNDDVIELGRKVLKTKWHGGEGPAALAY